MSMTPLQRMIEDAAKCNQRVKTLHRTGATNRSRATGPDGKPLCSWCNGPVERGSDSRYPMTCSPECAKQRRRRHKAPINQVVHVDSYTKPKRRIKHA